LDAIEPILPHPTTFPTVGAAERSGRVHRDGHDGGGAQGDSRHGRSNEEAVEVAVEGIDPLGDEDRAVEPPSRVPALLPGHRIDFATGGETDPPAHRIDLTA
jgi:hypothetical protein